MSEHEEERKNMVSPRAAHTHKPLPWESTNDSIYMAGRAGRIDSRVLFTFVGQGVSGEHAVDCATAAFIARACNAHYEMLAACEALTAALATIEAGLHVATDATQAAAVEHLHELIAAGRHAIAKARGAT